MFFCITCHVIVVDAHIKYGQSFKQNPVYVQVVPVGQKLRHQALSFRQYFLLLDVSESGRLRQRAL